MLKGINGREKLAETSENLQGAFLAEQSPALKSRAQPGLPEPQDVAGRGQALRRPPGFSRLSGTSCLHSWRLPARFALTASPAAAALQENKLRQRSMNSAPGEAQNTNGQRLQPYFWDQTKFRCLIPTSETPQRLSHPGHESLSWRLWSNTEPGASC